MFNENGSICNHVEPQPNTQFKDSGDRPSVTRALAIAASVVIVLAGVKAASGLLGPILLALFIAIILLIPLRFLQRNHCPSFLAHLIVIGGSVALFCLLTYFVSTSLNEFIGKIPAYKDIFTGKFSSIQKRLEQLGFELGTQIGNAANPPATPPLAAQQPKDTKNTPVNVQAPPENEQNREKETPPEDEGDKEKDNAEENKNSSIFPLHSTLKDEDLPTRTPEEVERWVRNVQDDKRPSLIAIDPQSVVVWITSLFLQLRHLAEGGFLVLIFSIFFLFEASLFSAKVDRAFGKDGTINNSHFHQIALDVRHYLVLKSIVNVASGSAAMFVYWLFGVPAWFFWGIMAFFLYYIPNIGGTLAAVIPGVLIFVNYDLPGVFLYALCLIAIECTIAYGFEPRFLGHGLGLSTVVILLTLVFWGWILGPIGLFLAAPLTVMLKIILAAFPETKWIATMLDDSRAVKQ